VRPKEVMVRGHSSEGRAALWEARTGLIPDCGWGTASGRMRPVEGKRHMRSGSGVPVTGRCLTGPTVNRVSAQPWDAEVPGTEPFRRLFPSGRAAESAASMHMPNSCSCANQNIGTRLYGARFPRQRWLSNRHPGRFVGSRIALDTGRLAARPGLPASAWHRLSNGRWLGDFGHLCPSVRRQYNTSVGPVSRSIRGAAGRYLLVSPVFNFSAFLRAVNKVHRSGLTLWYLERRLK
jgi:hypothetical protein